MKTRILRSVAAAAMCTAAAFGATAQQFEYDDLYYNILPDNTVEVKSAYPDEYSGDVVIPRQVSYNGSTYTVTGIGAQAFARSEITSIEIPNTVSSIGEKGIYQCHGLVSIMIPASVESIGEQAFASSVNLTEINVDEENKYFCSIDGVLYSKDVTILHACPGAKTEIDIPATVKEIVGGAFYCCMDLKDFEMPASLESIGDMAFFECLSLTKIELPDNLQSLGTNAFYRCENLESVSIGKNLNGMGMTPFCECYKLTNVTIDEANLGYVAIDNVVYARQGTQAADGMVLLWGAGGLQSVTIPDGVSVISDYAFSECKELASVEIPNSVREIRNEAFSQCESLAEVTIPKSVNNMGYNVFRNCVKLAKVSFADGIGLKTIPNGTFGGCGFTAFTVPDGFTSIEGSSFTGCENLVSVTIGSGVQIVGNLAFLNCNALKSVYCMAAVPPSTESGDYYNYYVFEQAVCEQATLYVPMGTRADYAADTEWGRFKNIVETDFAGVEDAVADDGGVKVFAADGTISVSGVADGTMVEVYGIGGGCVYRGTGSVVDGLSAGIYVVRAAGQVTKVVLK